MVRNRYDRYVEGRIDFSQLRMNWKTHKEIHDKMNSAYSNLTPYDKDVILKEAISALNTTPENIYESTENIRKIFKDLELI